MADTRSDFLRDEIRREILSGRLEPGARLPTERDLAARHKVSLTTINKVMAGLELEGLVERGRGRGTFVRPELGRRSAAVVLGPPHAPPGPRWRAHLARLALESAGRMPGGARAYLAAGTAASDETALARDARAGRIWGALGVGAGVAVAAVLEKAGVPFVELAACPERSRGGDGPAVRIAWGEAVGDLAAEMIRRGAAPLAIQLPPGAPGEAMAKAYRKSVRGARLRVAESLIGPAEQADGPAGWRWVESLLADGSVRGFILAGAEPEGALAALAQHAARIPDEVAVAVWAAPGAAPAFVREPARLELDAREIVQAGSEMLSALARGESAADVTVRPRFVPGETLPSGKVSSKR
ncbi:MAG TPA: GntR family transcriptional regulator [Phycisphaerae bacterium]|nr:GntR family transcriptional regulator [Phycisphaerae bacterium]